MYMLLNPDTNQPIAWSDTPKEGFIEVPDILRAVNRAYPHYVWDGQGLVKPAPVLPEPPTEAEIVKQLQTAVQEHMDDVARLNFYDNIKSAALRAAYPGPWQAEGIIYAIWMDNCWDKCYEVEAQVKQGIQPIPTPTELIAMLPPLPELPERV